MYSNATIKRARTILRNEEAGYEQRIITAMQTRTPRTPAPKAHVRPQFKSAQQRQDAMAGKLATIGQMEAINSYERTLGLKGYASLREFRAVVGDMRDASILRASLKAQIYG
jgi:hypothetical protein